MVGPHCCAASDGQQVVPTNSFLGDEGVTTVASGVSMGSQAAATLGLGTVLKTFPKVGRIPNSEGKKSMGRNDYSAGNDFVKAGLIRAAAGFVHAVTRTTLAIAKGIHA